MEYANKIGGVKIDIYRAQDPKGVGLVPHITDTGDVGFLVHAEVIGGGIELHLAGDQTERGLLDALQGAIGEYRVITDLLRV